MKPLQISRNKTLEVSLHIIVWIIAFGFPLVMMDRDNPDFSWMKFMRHAVVTLCYFVAFYINYFFLIPRYLFREQTGRFILYNAILIVLLSFFLHTWQTLTFPVQDIRHILRPGPPKWVFIIKDAFMMAFCIALSAIFRITKRWSQIENARREAEKSRTEAELKNLRNQLSPHFLLNTLNNIYALIAFDTSKA